MEKSPLEGDFKATPLPQVLFLIWRTEKTGILTINKEKTSKKFYFKKGNIVGEFASLQEGDFFKSLIKKKICNSDKIAECMSNSSKNKTSAIKSLSELNLVPPLSLWKYLEEFIKEDLFSLFDFPTADFSFKTENIAYESQILRDNQTINLILQGIRQMKNYDFIKNCLPLESEKLEILTPAYFNDIDLEPYEKFILNLIDRSKSLKDIYELSQSGKKDTQKCIFSFLMLGITSFQPKQKEEKHFIEFSPEEYDKIMRAFNKRLSYIYKYTSKEIGPVAFNTLKKTLEDIKFYLGPSFQTLELRPDGTISVKSFMKENINRSSDERWNNLIDGLNEILAAEVLTVKRTLGNTHEAVLVDSLKKMGDIL